MPQLREKRIDLILQQLDELPTLPAVVARVVEITGDDLASAHQVVNLISSDPALSARILQLIHRAGTGVASEVNSLDRAVVLLGFDAIRSAVLAISVFQCFGPRDPAAQGGHFSRDEFWKHCVAVACCAELLAESACSAKLSPSDAFICGLLHDMGKVALDATLPKSFSRVVEAADLIRGNIADIERNVIGIDHMVVGKRLAEKWKLPTVIRDCIWLHGQDPRALPATVKNPRMVNLITLADQIVREQHLGYSGNYAFPLSRETLINGAGLTPAMVESAVARLVSRIEPRAQSLGLGRTTTTELFQQALAQANKELGRVSGQLAIKNRKLTVRAQFLEALSKFQAELQPDAASKDVLRAIAQAAISVLGISCTAAFSLPSGQAYAETLFCDDQGRVFDTLLIDLPPSDQARNDHSAQTLFADEDCPSSGADSADCTSGESIASISDAALAVESAGAAAKKSGAANISSALFRPPANRAGEGPVLTAGEELEWFIDIVSPRLPSEKRFWICLQADEQCIGGVVWGAEAGEAQRLSPQVQELAAIAAGWAMALGAAQIREEARALAEQLAEANRQLQNAQTEILRSRTLITVGEMAAGAAHEMNNPLAIISGRSQLLAQQLSDPKFQAAARLVHEQADRLARLFRN